MVDRVDQLLSDPAGNRAEILRIVASLYRIYSDDPEINEKMARITKRYTLNGLLDTVAKRLGMKRFQVISAPIGSGKRKANSYAMFVKQNYNKKLSFKENSKRISAMWRSK